jgi:Amt family ammonium transporter
MDFDKRLAPDDTQVMVLPLVGADGSRTSVSRPDPSRGSTLPAARILLVDSSELEQFLASESLLRAGYECELAPSGRAALDVFLDDDIDAIVMDCQRDSDGLETVRTIRQHEGGQGVDAQHEPIPIVALTGAATHEDRQRCLTAGADACVSLPIDAGQLVSTIDGLLSVRRYDRRTNDARYEAQAASAPFDIDALLHRCLGDYDFSAQILRKFEARADGQRAALERAVASGNLEELRREAHSLKGVAANLSADALRSRAARLELAARTCDTHGLSQLLRETCDELARCVATIPQVLGRLFQGL